MKLSELADELKEHIQKSHIKITTVQRGRAEKRYIYLCDPITGITEQREFGDYKPPCVIGLSDGACDYPYCKTKGNCVGLHALSTREGVPHGLGAVCD